MTRRARLDALGFQHVEFNTASRISFLTLDIDRHASEDEWHSRDFPVPTILTLNPINGQSYLYAHQSSNHQARKSTESCRLYRATIKVRLALPRLKCSRIIGRCLA